MTLSELRSSESKGQFLSLAHGKPVIYQQKNPQIQPKIEKKVSKILPVFQPKFRRNSKKNEFSNTQEKIGDFPLKKPKNRVERPCHHHVPLKT